jgi:hypothetical protein
MLLLVGFSNSELDEPMAPAGMGILDSNMLASDIEPLAKQLKTQSKRILLLC